MQEVVQLSFSFWDIFLPTFAAFISTTLVFEVVRLFLVSWHERRQLAKWKAFFEGKDLSGLDPNTWDALQNQLGVDLTNHPTQPSKDTGQYV